MANNNSIDLSEFDNSKLFGRMPKNALNLHPVKVSVWNVRPTHEVLVNPPNSESWRNHPIDTNGMDVQIDFKEESGQDRSMIITFHKGSCFMKWVKYDE